MTGQAIYDGYGLHFQYPADWTMTEDEGEESVTITVQSPGTTFWCVTILDAVSDPDETIESTVAAFREVYPDLDEYPQFSNKGMGLQAACELNFVLMDLITTVSLVAYSAADQSFLVMYQGHDREVEEMRGDLESITRSLRIEGEPIEAGEAADE